jgi:hypothetical protein
MAEDLKVTSVAGVPEFKIERLNSDKTRKDIGSDTVYHVYFELSENPPGAWRDIFEREWERSNPGVEAEIDGPFLVLHCQLHEVATVQLPALKKALRVTNGAFVRHVRQEAAGREQREDVWKQERKDVEAMAQSLKLG